MILLLPLYTCFAALLTKRLSLKILSYFQKANGSSVVNLTNHLKTATATIKCGEGPNVDIPQTGVPGVSVTGPPNVKGKCCPMWKLINHVSETGKYNLLAE
jgi:hypothetical protein